MLIYDTLLLSSKVLLIYKLNISSRHLLLTYLKGATGGAGVHAVMMWWDGPFSFVFQVFPCPVLCFPSLFRLDVAELILQPLFVWFLTCFSSAHQGPAVFNPSHTLPVHPWIFYGRSRTGFSFAFLKRLCLRVFFGFLFLVAFFFCHQSHLPPRLLASFYLLDKHNARLRSVDSFVAFFVNKSILRRNISHCGFSGLSDISLAYIAVVWQLDKSNRKAPWQQGVQTWNLGAVRLCQVLFNKKFGYAFFLSILLVQQKQAPSDPHMRVWGAFVFITKQLLTHVLMWTKAKLERGKSISNPNTGTFYYNSDEKKTKKNELSVMMLHF